MSNLKLRVFIHLEKNVHTSLLDLKTGWQGHKELDLDASLVLSWLACVCLKGFGRHRLLNACPHWTKTCNSFQLMCV